MDYETVFSEDRRHRYWLHRALGGRRGLLVFVGLNPSTADAVKDDPTIRRCIRYGEAWGYSDLLMLNIFSLRSTDPKKLYRAKVPSRPENDVWIERACSGADMVVAAWGTHGALAGRGDEVLRLLRKLGGVYALKVTKEGHPAHPLYLRADLRPEPYRPNRAGLVVRPVQATDCLWGGGGAGKADPAAGKGADEAA